MEVLFFQMEILFFRRHIALKIDKIKLYNTQGLKLKLDLMFKFVNL